MFGREQQLVVAFLRRGSRKRERGEIVPETSYMRGAVRCDRALEAVAMSTLPGKSRNISLPHSSDTRLVIHVAEHISVGLIDPFLRPGVAVTSITHDGLPQVDVI